MNSRRFFLQSVSQIPWLGSLSLFAQDLPLKNDNSKFSHLEWDNQGDIIYVSENQNEIIRTTIVSLNQTLTPEFTYQDFMIPLFIKLNNEKKSNLICFVDEDDGFPIYHFIEFYMENNSPQFVFRGKLDTETKDSNQETLLNSDDFITGVLFPQGDDFEKNCDILLFIQNEETFHKKIIAVQKNLSCPFTKYEILNSENITQDLYINEHCLFEGQTYSLISKEYGNQVAFYGLNYNGSNFEFSLLSCLEHQEKMHEEWDFQFPKLESLSLDGNDIDRMYTPFQHSYEKQNPSLLFKTTTDRFCCLQFDSHSQENFKPTVLAFTAPMPEDQFSFLMTLNSANINGQKEIAWFHETNVGYFFLSLEKNSNDQYEFVRHNFPLEELISKNISVATADDQIAWEYLLNFFAKNYQKSDEFQISISKDNLHSFGDHQYGLHLFTMVDDKILSHFVFKIDIISMNITLEKSQPNVVHIENDKKPRIQLQVRPKYLVQGIAARALVNREFYVLKRNRSLVVKPNTILKMKTRIFRKTQLHGTLHLVDRAEIVPQEASFVPANLDVLASEPSRVAPVLAPGAQPQAAFILTAFQVMKDPEDPTEEQEDMRKTVWQARAITILPQTANQDLEELPMGLTIERHSGSILEDGISRELNNTYLCVNLEKWVHYTYSYFNQTNDLEIYPKTSFCDNLNRWLENYFERNKYLKLNKQLFDFEKAAKAISKVNIKKRLFEIVKEKRLNIRVQGEQETDENYRIRYNKHAGLCSRMESQLEQVFFS